MRKISDFSQLFTKSIVVLLLLLISLKCGFSLEKTKQLQSEKSCRNKQCSKPKEGYLNVHLVPHSHQDLGWLKTIDEYYYGDKPEIAAGSVQYTLDSVISELQKSPDRRFVYSEMGFFWRWWTNQNQETKDIVKDFVQTGQLEFVGGGWSMNDEACTHYTAIIHQMTLGLRFINETFGECALPRVAWQIDTFGHSRETASLFAQMGFDGVFIARLDYQDKFNRLESKNMETIWSASPNNLGKEAWLFTSVLFDGYDPPPGFCFDLLCKDVPIKDNPLLSGFNVNEKVDKFLEAMKKYAAPYESNNILVPMGSDFHYMAAHTWYSNLDKLIKYVNERQLTNSSKVNLLYSTPSCYMEEVYKSGIKFSLKTDDFFPYASAPNDFWTGYFTSRPTFKYFIQKSNSFLQICKQLLVNVYTEDGEFSKNLIAKLWELSEAVALMQHHDAITGTARERVTQDYSLRLWKGVKSAEQVLNVVLKTILMNPINAFKGQNDTIGYEGFQICHELNVSSCNISETSEDFVVFVYNPLARNVLNSYIRIPVSTVHWIVTSSEGLESSQLAVIPNKVHNIPGRTSNATFELVFRANVLPALSFAKFRITKQSEQNDKSDSEIHSELKPIKTELLQTNKTTQKDDFWISNSFGLSISFDGSSGLLKRLKRGNSEINLSQDFYIYKGMLHGYRNYNFTTKPSGAYLFRPYKGAKGEQQPQPVGLSNYTVYKGEHVTEVHQTFCPWISQVIRLYDHSDEVEFEWLIGPIPTKDAIDKEIVTKYTSDLNTNEVFFTDSNGRELLKRRRNFRETWQYKVNENVSGNYYPVNSRMILSEENNLGKTEGKSLILLNDRTQGGTSLKDGEMEIMLHRRLLFDDGKGLNEVLDEKAFGKGIVVRGKHWLVFAGDQTGVPASAHRPLAQQISMEKLLVFAPSELLFEKRLSKETLKESKHPDFIDLSLQTTLFSSISAVFPQNINLLTLELISEYEFLLRLEHFYENGESSEYSQPVNISLQALRKALPFKFTIKETNLSGQKLRENADRFKWELKKTTDVKCSENNCQNFQPITKLIEDEIILKPMQIRTFIIKMNETGTSRKSEQEIVRDLITQAHLLKPKTNFSIIPNM